MIKSTQPDKDKIDRIYSAMKEKKEKQKDRSAFILIALVFIVMIFAANYLFYNWEYKVVAPSDFSLDRELNQLGEDGWELVSARRATSYSTAKYEMIFKRSFFSSIIN